MNHIVLLDVSSDEEDDYYSGVLDEKPKVEVEDGDDDCVVLDGDPYKTKETALDTCETDEVVVLGQKGEIACRDFPHPRHACAKYPFNSTLHHNYCEMCHCYVCDIPAPCPNWSMGFSSTDHCHATDKDHVWKSHREWVRTGKLLPCPVSKPQNSSSPVTHFGIRPCSASTMDSYIRPAYRAEQPRSLPRYPGLQPRAVQFNQNQNYRPGSYIGHPSPQVGSSNPYAWTRTPTPSNDVYLPENGMHNLAHGSQYIPYAPSTAIQGNLQLFAGSYTVPESQNKDYYRHFSQNMYSYNMQPTSVPSGNPNPLTRQHQQRQQQHHQLGRNDDKMLSEFEDWLMDNSPPAFPLSGQDNSTTFDLESFLR